MASILNNALTGLRVHQGALSTTSHNVANVNTDGYSRQRVEITTNPPQETPNGFFGQGAQIGGVTRIASEFLIRQLRADTIAFNELDALGELSAQLDNLLSNTRTNLSSGLDEFFSAMQVAADDPASLPVRQVVLSQANSLTQQFAEIDARLGSLQDTVNRELGVQVSELNALLAGIGELNAKIGQFAALPVGEQPNDLLDRRDELLRRTGELIGINVIEGDSGKFNVFLQNGHALVTGNQVNEVALQESASDPTVKEFVLRLGNQELILTDQVSGGRIGGLLSFRSEFLGSGFNELGRVALAFADAFNEVHQNGMDLDGDVGNLLFGDVNERNLALGRVIPATGNASTDDPVTLLEIDDINALVASDYELRIGTTLGPNVIEVTRLSDGSSVAIDMLDTNLPQTLEFDGLRLTLESGSYVTGDRFKLTPYRDFPGQISLQVEDPRDLALAQPVRGDASQTNSGSGILSLGDTLDTQGSQYTTLQIGALTNFEVGDTVQFDVVASESLDSFTVNYTVTGVPSVAEELASQMQAAIDAQSLQDDYLVQANAVAGTVSVVYKGSENMPSSLRLANFTDDLAGAAGSPAGFSVTPTFGSTLPSGGTIVANTNQSISVAAPWSFAVPGDLSPPMLIRFTSPTTYDILDASDPANPVDLVPPRRNIDYVAGQAQELFPSDDGQTFLNADGALVGRALLGAANGYGADTITITTTDPDTTVSASRTITTAANESADSIAEKLNGIPGVQASAGAEATLTALGIADPNITELVINGVPLPGATTLADVVTAVAASAPLRSAGIVAELDQAGTTLTLRSVTGADINISMTGAAGGDSVTVTGLNASGANPPSAVVDAANPLATVGGSVTVFMDETVSLSSTGIATGLFSAQPIAVSSFTGYTFTLTGEPAVGDEFSIEFNTNGVSDNRNALKFVQLQTTKITDNGTTTFDEAYSRLVERVATKSAEAATGRDAAEALLRQSEAQREALSGVNLDEEAADVIRFQQAYNASAQLITVARSIFDSLLAAVQ